MKPLIGITCVHDVDAGQVSLAESYLLAIEAAGGIPLPLPSLASEAVVTSYAVLVDGLLLSGGVDLDPVYFSEEPRGTKGISPVRDRFELSFLAEITRQAKPVLAICRGIQVLNVFAGGDLYQDLATQHPEALKHWQEAPPWYGTHRVRLVADSRLAGVYGCAELRVNSFHHQALRRVAPGYQVVARADDGVIEAIEGTGPVFAVGVQWHPERMWDRDEKQAGLFRVFVEACAARSGHRQESVS